MPRRRPPDPAALRLLVAGLTTALDTTTAEIATAFSRAGIPCILLKGPSHARWLYEDELDRGYVDIDLLVPSDVAAAAGELLQANGFDRSLQEIALPHGRRPHAVTWIRGVGRIEVDLHDTLPGVGVSPALVWAILGAETEPMTVGGVELDVLREPARALLVALHAGHHGPAETQPLRDLELALDRGDASLWREAAALAERLDAVSALASGLRLLPAGEVVAAKLELPTQASVESILRSSSAPELALSFDWLVRAPSHRVRATLVLRKLAPPVGVMRARSRLARRGPAGLAAAYLVQPLEVAWRGVPALRAWLAAKRRASG